MKWEGRSPGSRQSIQTYDFLRALNRQPVIALVSAQSRLNLHFCSSSTSPVEATVWDGSKGVINFPWIFHAMRSLVPVGHFPNISGHFFTGLVCRSFQWRHGLLFTDCIVLDDKDKVTGFKKSHWIHLGRWSTGSPKFQLFQLSQRSYVTHCRLTSSSAYFPWNMSLKYKMQLPEGSWDKILHSKLRTVFLKGRFFLLYFLGGLSLKAIYQSSGSSFRDFFARTTKERNPFGTTPWHAVISVYYARIITSLRWQLKFRDPCLLCESLPPFPGSYNTVIYVRTVSKWLWTVIVSLCWLF